MIIGLAPAAHGGTRTGRAFTGDKSGDFLFTDFFIKIKTRNKLLDDLGWEEINKATLQEWQKTAADYAMYVPDNNVKITKAAGEWNTTRIIFTDALVEHWLNGKKVLSFVPWSDDWNERKNKGKWKDYPNYGASKTGFIGLQDHDSPLWFKNIKIKKL